jgi:hypothetical protein
LGTNGYAENKSYIDTFSYHKLLSEETFMAWGQIKEVVASGALSSEAIRAEFRKAAVTSAAPAG